MGTNKRYYRAVALQGVLGETKGGNPQVAVLFEILDEDATHPQLTWYGYFTDKTEKRTVESLRIAGMVGTDLTNITFPEDAPEVQLVVEDEEYDGQVSAKVQWVNRAGGLAVKAPLSADKAKILSEKMKGYFAIADAKAGARKSPPPPGRRPEAPPHTDKDAPPLDDLPF